MKAVTLVLLWLLASAAAIGVAWSGVGVLDDDLVAPAPAVVIAEGEVGLISESLDDADLAASGGRSTLEATGQSMSTTTSTSTTATTAETAATPSIATTATTSGTTNSATTRASASSSASTSATSMPATTTATTPQPEQFETKTFPLVGGVTSIRFSPSETKVLWATPNPGFEVRIEPESDGVKVEFRSDDHRSRLDAWWENGPRHEIQENG